jgi:hypothetical protein
MTKRPLVLIEWHDAYSIHGWTPPEEVTAASLSPITTVGFLLHETKESVWLASSLDHSEPTKTDPLSGVAGSMVIPKAMIVRRKALKQ